MNRLATRAALLLCAVSLANWPGNLRAQVPGDAPPPPPAPAQFDPSETFLKGWLLAQDGEAFAKDGKHVEALEKLQSAQQLFDRIAHYFPDWRKDMLQGRRDRNRKAVEAVAPLANRQLEKEQKALAGLEGRSIREGVIEGSPARPFDSGNPAVPLTPAAPLESLSSSRIADLEKQVRDLTSQLRNSPNASRDSSRAHDIARQRDFLQAKLKESQDELNRLRAKVAEEPVHEELRRLTQRIDGLERERAALNQALNKSREENDLARSKTQALQAQIDALQTERARLRQENSDLTANLNREREAQDEVVSGQQAQIRRLTQELRNRNDELTKANQRITDLQQQVDEIQAQYTELQQSHQLLTEERNQLKALLKMSEGGRVQELIDQNTQLHRQLREAEDRVKRLTQNNHEANDELANALNDQLIARKNLIRFRQEKVSQDRRIQELEARLRREEKNLAGEAAHTDPGEAEMLRGIIRKQLRVQDRRRQAREFLLDALGQEATQNEDVASALRLFKEAETPLTIDELRLLNEGPVDAELVAPSSRSPEEVNAALARLGQKVSPFADAGKRAFLGERYQSARELFELALEMNPGDIRTRCCLGTIQLRLGEYQTAAESFRHAATLDTDNPYAHRMLGYSLLQTGDLIEAHKALVRATELAPTNALGHIYLGTALFEMGNLQDAEAALKTAVQCDDAIWQSHLNLAQLYASQNRRKLGLESYREALKRGAPSNFDLEAILGSASTDSTGSAPLPPPPSPEDLSPDAAAPAPVPVEPKPENKERTPESGDAPKSEKPSAPQPESKPAPKPAPKPAAKPAPQPAPAAAESEAPVEEPKPARTNRRRMGRPS